uniref:IBB domain-containing protein n=1 Tax=Parastrongyloides trichosuri TaxID=131310 RepID=A0A0N4ZJ22_PARTI
MYKGLKVKLDKFIIKAKQSYRRKELQSLRQNHRRSSNELHSKLEKYKPLDTLYETDDDIDESASSSSLKELTNKDLKNNNNNTKYNSISSSTTNKINEKKSTSDNNNNNNNHNNKNRKISKICSNILGTTLVYDLVTTDITF